MYLELIVNQELIVNKESSKPVAQHTHRVGDKVSWQPVGNGPGCRSAGTVTEVYERSITTRNAKYPDLIQVMGIDEFDVQKFVE